MLDSYSGREIVSQFQLKKDEFPETRKSSITCFFFFTLFSIIANTYLNFWICYTIEIVEQLKVLLQAIDGGGNLG